MILSTWSTLESVREIILTQKVSAVIDIAGIIACIAAAIAGLKVVLHYFEGHNLNAWEIGKPLILMMMVCNFNTFVLKPVDAIVNIISRETIKIMDVDTGEYVTRWAESMHTMTVLNIADNEQNYQKELEEIAENDSVIGRFFAKLWYGVKKFALNFFSVRTMSLAGLIGGILFTLVKVLLFAQQIMCCLYMTLNGIFGPFVMAISIIPGYEGGMKGWIARYLQVALWVPIGYIILGLSLLFVEGFCTLAQQGVMGLGVEWTMIVLQCVTLAAVASVPKIAGWWIESTGANDAHGSVTNPMRMMARRFIKA